MELKEITSRILNLFGANDTDSFTDSVRDVIFSKNRDMVFDKYLELCPDMSVDWLQRVYQFYCSDRKEKKQDYTPVCLSRLIASLTCSDEKIVYDCCSGSGSLVIQKWNTNKNLSFICEELDDNVIPILLFNLCIRNIEATVINKNVLSGEVFGSYKVTKGDKYGTIQRLMFPDVEELKSDTSISNPPFNLNVPVSNEITLDLPDKYTCNFAFVSRCLHVSNGICAIILPMGVLSSKKEIPCRKYFVEKGWLKAAISLPEKMFESTSVATCILLFDKRKTSKDVMLVNAAEMKSVEIREQRGEGDASHYNRIYKKEFNTFTDEQIIALCELTVKEQHGFSKIITEEELETHDYNLSLRPYLPIELEGTLHRDFNDIIHDINRVIRERNVIKVTVNKVWADRLGLTAVIKDCEASNEVVKAINDSFSMFDNYKVKEKIIENKYIQSSNSKVFSIENTDKEKLSSIMPFFMNMYKQHIYYLNEEENRLLGELRDSMLPLLMNGELKIKDTDKTMIP